MDCWTGRIKPNNLFLKTPNDFQFIIVGSTLYQPSIVYRKNNFVKLSVLQLKGLFPFLINFVTNFTFREKISKVIWYTIYNFVHTTEHSQLSWRFNCFKIKFVQRRSLDCTSNCKSWFSLNRFNILTSSSLIRLVIQNIW